MTKSINTAEAYQRQGDLLFELEQWQEAMDAYEKALALDASLEKSYYQLGEISLKLGQWDKAITAYQKALQLNPNRVSLHRQLGYALEQRAKTHQKSMLDTYIEGIKKNPHEPLNYHKALEFQPKNLQLHLGLAKALVEKKQWEEAIIAYQNIIIIDPNNAGAYCQLAQILQQQGRKEALDCWYKALKLQPNLAQPQEHVNLGNAFLQEQPLRAADCYRLALQLQANFLPAYYGLGEVYVTGEYWEDALEIYQKLSQLEPNNAQIHHQIGEIFSKRQRFTEAISAYSKAILLNPNFSWSHHNLGYALLKVNRLEEAVNCFTRAIELYPFVWSYYNLGEALLELKRWDEAIVAYTQAEKLQNDIAYIPRKLSYAFHQKAKENLQQAALYYRLVLQQEPKDLETYYQILEIEPEDAQLYRGLGNALAQENQFKKAIAAYEQALQLKPNDQAIKSELERLIVSKNLLFEGGLTASESILYQLWLEENSLKTEELAKMSQQLQTFSYQPLISIIVPIYNTPESYLKAMIQSVLEQIYPHWELCIADDNSPSPYVKQILQEYAAKDSRIKLVFRDKNGHISAASNSALALATGEFISLLDHDDLLTKDALYQVVSLLNQHPDADMIYSDEDKIDEEGKLSDPFFKPDWSPDYFLSQMYTCHFGTYRRSIVNAIEGFRIGYEGSQDYDLVLRFTEKTSKIYHIPKILYHWRIHDASAASGGDAKPYAYEAGKKALEEAIVRRGEPGKIIHHSKIPGVYTVRYEIKEYKLVSIIIPTRNLGSVLERCLQSIFTKTTYPNFEVILIDNDSDEPDTLAVFEDWLNKEPNRFSCHRLDIPFNYSRINNYALTQAKGDYLLFLNNDTEVISEDWLEAMVEQAQRKSIGAVGARLLYPDNTIQHAGVAMGVLRVAAHLYKNFPATHPGYCRQLLCNHNYSAVTAACLMCRREVFEEVGGFEESLAIAFNDVDLCLKILSEGYKNIALPHVVLYHHESKSRGMEDTPEKQKRFQQEIDTIVKKWQIIIDCDPCYNPNLSKIKQDCSLKLHLKIEISSISITRENNENLRGFSFDLPKPGKYNQDIPMIGGWVVGKRLSAQIIELVCEEKVVQTIPVNQFRTDVASLYPDAPNVKLSGFSSFLDILQFPRQSEIIIQVVLEDKSVVELGNFNLYS